MFPQPFKSQPNSATHKAYNPKLPQPSTNFRISPPDGDSTSPDEDVTVSSASLLLSPRTDRAAPPLCASTPMHGRGNDNCDGKLNGNVDNSIVNHSAVNNGNGPVVSESTHSIDVLSGGESDTGDTLSRSRLNNNSISSGFIATVDRKKRGGGDLAYCIAKQLLMTERTYKRDLQLVTVTWSISVSGLATCHPSLVEALGRPCLALEPLALAQGAFLAALEQAHRAHTPVATRLAGGGAGAAVPRAGAFLAALEQAHRAHSTYSAHSDSACSHAPRWSRRWGGRASRWSLPRRARAGPPRAQYPRASLVEALGRPCLALEPSSPRSSRPTARTVRIVHIVTAPVATRLAGGGAGAAVPRAGAFLAALEQAHRAHINRENEESEPEYKRIAELLYEYLSKSADAYTSYTHRAGALLARLESARRGECAAAAGTVCAAFDCAAPLPLACLLLRPLHALLLYTRRAAELSQIADNKLSSQLHELTARLAEDARGQLRHAENHAALCQLQRDILGYDKLLVADREFLKLGCVFKHSTKGLQQRMLFLFSDMVLMASKASGGAQFRAHLVLPLHSLAMRQEETNCLTLIDGDNMVLKASGLVLPLHSLAMRQEETNCLTLIDGE
ncbi:unnamed protein product [Plutella xylostella]|uniref:(diamondback moth) hypothetical protein n=1 Tax=Plutella xylostella TaxID=51655 RepID=A0A8S4DXL6_PLUXY|nr:unnamed protein product [Plutella xylostella]